MRLLIVFMTLAMGSPWAVAAMVFAEDLPEEHNRFDSTMFIGASYDWSGVGRGSGGGWATMIFSATFPVGEPL